ncbi:MAG: serine/threonine protein kinase [Kofleriaceae bacterium]|nr:serine/threonine protein kinase [Kofleriaceae bacterium]MBP9169290.1 serine/threonine protein kinase [Kofleriaceae bacterium]MBP9859001.1 serine/threonine protein kinase [Kofleriaceae bacterium]
MHGAVTPGDRRYQMVRRLGAGGMAEVYEAVMIGAHGFTRRVAVKQIAAELALIPGLIDQFLDEARLAARLHHAGIVGVLDYGVVDGRPFQVLEFVDGVNASELRGRAGGRLPVEIALIIAADVAHALDHAHRATDGGRHLGLVHRDVKPGNLLVSWDGDVKLSDFGIAWAHDRAAPTETGVVRGTVPFMAPEQRLRGALDGRTDVYGLGCALHVLLAGASPVEAPAAIAASLLGEPPTIAPEVPADLAAVIARACAPRPDDRFATAGDLADALGRLLAQRLDRDARGHLRGFLATLRPTRRRPGLLDQLLGVELVPAEDDPAGRPDGPPTFRLRPTSPDPATAPLPPPPPPPTQDAGPAPADDIPRPAPRPRRRWLAVATLGALASGGTLAVRALGDRSAPATAAVGPGLDAAVAPGQRAAPAVDAAVDAAPLDDAAPDAAGPTVDAGVGDAVARPVRPTTPRPPLDAGVRPADGPATAERGWLQVAGPGLARARVVIDGVARGYAPNPIEVPVGRHQVVLERDDGTTVGPFAIEVTPFHTRTRPLRPSL